MLNRDASLYKIIGNYVKSKINENGEKLIDLCNIHNLRITNTFFKHKPIHQTTWQSPSAFKNIIDSRTNKQRKNLYRNQIDYILVKNNIKPIKITDCKSIIDRITQSDHKPVIMETKNVYPVIRPTKPIIRINVNQLIVPEVKRNYKESVLNKMNNLQLNFVDAQDH